MQTLDQPITANGAVAELVAGADSAIVVGMTAMLRARLVDAAGAAAPPQNIGDVASWRFVLAEDWDPATAPCYLSTAVAYDPATATWTVPLDGTRTAQALSALGKDGERSIGCEIAGIPENGTWDRPVFVLQWTAKLRNRRDSDGVILDPYTGEIVATTLRSSDRRNSMRISNDDTLVVKVGGSTVEVNMGSVAAVLSSGITAETVDNLQGQAAKIVSPNGRTVVDVTNSETARFYVRESALGGAVVSFGSRYGISYGDAMWSTSIPVSVEFVGPFACGTLGGYVWLPATCDAYPAAYAPDSTFWKHTSVDYLSNWHLYGSSASAPQYLRFKMGPRYAITDWDSVTPTLELDVGQDSGTIRMVRSEGDATAYKPLETKDHSHYELLSPSGAQALRLENSGAPQLVTRTAGTRGVADTATVSWGNMGVAIFTFGGDHTWAELGNGVASFPVSVVIYPDTTANNSATTYVAQASGTAVLSQSASGISQYTITSSFFRLGGMSLLIGGGGILQANWRDVKFQPTPQEYTVSTTTQTEKTSRTVETTEESSDSLALLSDIPPQPQLRYALVEPTLTTSGTTVSATLQDRAVNAVTLASTVTAATFTFPAPVAGYARDFFLRLVIEGSTVPTISFLESGGGSLEDVFDADDDAWAEIESGVNVLMFTETSQEAGS